MDENNQIQFTNLTLDSAFQKFYTVPDYQREYVWKEEQVEQLLADITEAFRANRSKDYFVGSVVVYPNGKAFELVDGQQRMTTFFILLCVLKSFYQSNGIDTGIFEQCIHGTTVDDSGRPVSLYHLELQYEDTSSCLQTISKVKFPIEDKDATGKDNLLFKAANTIYKYILQQFPSFDNELAPFTGYVLRRVRFVQIETHDMSDALKIFETINQRGIGLTPMDLLKNMIFRQVKREQFGELNVRWKRMVDLLQKGKAKELPLRFLRYYLMATYDTTVGTKDGILREDSIYNWLNSQKGQCGYEDDPFGFVQGLTTGAERYMFYLTGGDGAGDNHLKNIVRLGGSASKLHLLLLLAAVNMDEQALTHLKALLESMVYYSTVNQIKTNELERLYAQWCKQIREIHTDKELTSFINNKIKPTISQWKVNNRSNFMRIGFDSMQQYRVKFILARITKYVDVRRKNGGDASNVAEFYEGGIEIEHIMPQKYSAAYSKKFREEHEEEILLHQAAKNAFDDTELVYVTVVILQDLFHGPGITGAGRLDHCKGQRLLISGLLHSAIPPVSLVLMVSSVLVLCRWTALRDIPTTAPISPSVSSRTQCSIKMLCPGWGKLAKAAATSPSLI